MKLQLLGFENAIEILCSTAEGAAVSLQVLHAYAWPRGARPSRSVNPLFHARLYLKTTTPV